MTSARALVRDAERAPLWSTVGQPLPTSAQSTPRRANVVVIGAGYTGLWTALYLKRLNPALDVVVVDADGVGFGASGRNGGWCSALLPFTLSDVAQQHGHQIAVDMRLSALNNFHDMRSVLSDLAIECDYVSGGTLTVARNPIQALRLEHELSEGRHFGASESDLRLSRDLSSSQHVLVSSARAALFTPHCAALHPRRLVDGLARVCKTLGVVICEGIRVERFTTGHVEITRGGHRSSISCDWVVRATEGYTSRFRGSRRALLPLYSFMVATEPLSEATVQGLRWTGRETVNDARNGVVYAQLTADNRIAFGGRGAPYHFGSRVQDRFDFDDSVHQSLVETLHEFFPVTRNVAITHRWGGPLGVPRDWRNFVHVDESTRLATGGGYSGDGVALAHLTGRMIAHAITRHSHVDLTLPWFGHENPTWEPEPLRWLGVNSLRLLVDSIDDTEERSSRASRIRSAVVDRFL